MFSKPFSLNRPANPAGLPELPTVSRGLQIPKIIHQTNSVGPWAEPIENSVAKTRAINPDWEYRFYSNEQRREYVEERCGKGVLSFYDKINPAYGAAQADLFRYLVIYLDGGVYLDIKSGCHRPLSETIDPGAHNILSRWPNGLGDQYDQWGIHPELRQHGGESFQQWNIISEPGHPFLRDVILTVLRNIKDYNPVFHSTGRSAVFNITGPIAYTVAIYAIIDREQHIVLSTSDLGLYYNIYDEDGLGNEGHTSANHYSRLAGAPVIRLTSINMFLYRCVRRWGRINRTIHRI